MFVRYGKDFMNWLCFCSVSATLVQETKVGDVFVSLQTHLQVVVLEAISTLSPVNASCVLWVSSR